ncbi:HAD-IA family hydrolase [Sporosarcina sp. ANT_H38]|uniref:HAD family hydrolase n=1 Tax=Sporosarcina sp. ANT_H38 TaxID=2597358 RepID=UPI0011F28F7B|nr:HAD-IA family hydrolase [Sporosarcina sp. ANT_H38]KAA0965763.1 HAD-IA family hydrolase [Sporosarcina sp. ANT_H38]
MIKAVLFDLDGNLLDREVSLERFIKSQHERLNKSVGHILKEQYVSKFIELDCRGYIWKDKVYQQMVAEFNITGVSWEQLLQDYVHQFKGYCVPFPNLIQMLTSLTNQSIVLGIISNGKGQFQMDNIMALGIEHYFETILISEKEGIKKPDPLLFKKALEQLNITPNECIFVGDHPENDVKASKDVGMLAAWKKTSEWENVEEDFIVHDLMEVPLLKELIVNKERTMAINELPNRGS